MRSLTKHYKRLRVGRLKVAFLVIFLNIIMIPQYQAVKPEGDNLFKVFVNEEYVGTVGKRTDIDSLIIDARRQIASASDSIIFLETDYRKEGEEVIFGDLDSDEVVEKNILNVLLKEGHVGLNPAYTVKVGNNTLNLATIDDVKTVLQGAIDAYDVDHEFAVSLKQDTSRELNNLTAEVMLKEEAELENEVVIPRTAGIEAAFDEAFDAAAVEKVGDEFEDFEYGLLDINYGNSIEIVDAYLLADNIMTAEEGLEVITSKQDKNTVYEVQSGDTLGGISMKMDIPMEKIIALNDSLDDEKSMIRVGQELLVLNPEPPLSVERIEQEYVEEDYDEDIIYIDNDEWYTNEQVTRQQPSAGHRNIVAQITYRNDKEVSREVLKEEVVLEAVPKIVERGTKTPPTYIKPISGGRLSSTFGGRKAPTKGASSNHQGIDWAIAQGSAVYASSGGTVTKAGWAKGYGYVVYIQHPDGKETRYGHLSKVLVSPGQKVKQGEKVALSGNSGVSTGPHLHFEIRLNGAALNPLKYIN